MGDHTYSKTKLGCSIPHNKHISTKILSILLAILLVTTVFSSITLAKESNDDSTEGKNIVASILGDVKEKISSAGSKLGSRLRDLIDRIRENRKGLLSLSLVTRYQEEGSSTIQETSTRLRLLLPTSLDVNRDTKKDIRVWIIRRPAIDLHPPALCWKTSLIVRRLPGMDNIKDDFLELYLEYTPRVLSILDADADRIRIGYQSPMGKEIPKTCIVSHKNIPHLIYPREKPAHRVAINPLQLAGESQLNLLFSIVDIEDDKVMSELSMQINHTPAVRNEFSIERRKDHFVRRGQTLVLSRQNVNSNVSLYIKEGPLFGGSLTVESLPKKITLGWKLARTGYVEISTEGSKTGAIKYKVDGAVDIGFKPETALDLRIDWKFPYLIGRLLKKGFNFEVSGGADATLSDFYVHAETIDWTMSKFSLNASGKGGVYNLKLLKSQLDTVYVEAENVDVAIEDSVMTLIPPEAPEKPTVAITNPQPGDTVDGTVHISGTASAPPGTGKDIEYVVIIIDDSEEEIVASGTTSWSYDWDTTSLFNGEHTIKAQSFDGEYFSDPDSISVTVEVDNEGNNWYPLISIDSPENGAVVSEIVQIRGTANDPHGAVAKVEIRFNEGGWVEATSYDETTGVWTYEWDTTSLAVGKYLIEARSFDGVIYSLEPAHIQVSIKGAPLVDVDALDFSLEEASIKVTNFVVSGLNNNNVTKLEILSFVANGNGSLEVTEDSLFVEAAGVLDLQNTSIVTTNASGVEVKLVDNLSAYFDGYGMVGLSPDILELAIRATLSIHADGIAGSNEFHIGLNGDVSAGIVVQEDGSLIFKGANDDPYMEVNVTDLIIDVPDLLIGADQILVQGNGSIIVYEKQLYIHGALDTCDIDNFYVNASFGTLSVSGKVYFSGTASLTLTALDPLSFNLSFNGPAGITIEDPEVGIRSPDGEVSASAERIEISGIGGYAAFSYKKDDFNVSCHVKIGCICAVGLLVRFDESSYPIGDICGPFEFTFNLSADIKIEMGDDWIKITIGGRYRYIKAYSEFYFNDEPGVLDVDIELEKNEDIIEINISGIPDDIAVEIDGNTNVTLIKKLYLNLPGIVLINISKVNVSFGLHATARKGNLLLNLTDADRLLEMGYVYVNISNLFEATIEGSIASSHSGSGSLNITWNESGLAGLDIEADGSVELNFTDFYLDISSEVSFLMAEFAMFKITGDVELGFKDGFMDVSADLSGNDIKIITRLESQDLYLSLEIGSLLVERGGLFTWEDKNLSFTSYSDTRFGLYDFSLDLIWEGSAIYLIMEESDIVFSGADITIDIDFSGDNITVAVDELTPYANVEINTLWANLLGLVEVRVHELVISVPTTVSLEGGQVTVSLDEGIITAEEIFVINLLEFVGDIGLYGLDVDLSDAATFSLGRDADGSILLDFSAAVDLHLDALLISGSIIPDIDLKLEGEGSIKINLNDQVFLAPVLHLEASVTENTTISFGLAGKKLGNIIPILGEIIDSTYLVIKLEPGLHLVNTDLFGSVFNFIFSSTSSFTVGLKDPLSPLEFHAALQISGHIEIENISGASSGTGFLVDNIKMAGLFKWSRYKLIGNDLVERYIMLNGEGSGGFLLEKDDEGKSHATGIWDDGYITIITPLKNLQGETSIVRFVLHDVDFNVKLGSGQGIIWFIKWFFLDGGLGIWVLDENGEWDLKWPWPSPPLYPPDPPVKGVVTLFAENKVTTSVEIIPGDDVAFTALYVPAIFTDWINSDYCQPGQHPGQQQGQQPIGDEKLTFELEYGDGESQIFEVNYSDEPIKVDLGKHKYTSLGTFTTKLNVSGDPDADEDAVAVDTTEINSIDKYLGVTSIKTDWNYDEVSDDGKIYGSFEVKNKAHEIYSGDYVLEWEIVEDYTKDMKWGTEWIFTPDNDSLPPDSSQIVNFSFIPPPKGDYLEDDDNHTDITVIDKNNSQTEEVKFELEYGYIDLLPDSLITLYMPSGGTEKTFKYAFWVYSRYWGKQGVPWEVNYTYSNANTEFNFTCIPDSGVKHRGELPDVDLLVEPISIGKYEYEGKIKVEKTGDPADNDIVNIKLVVGKSNIPIDITLFDYDGDWINKGEYFRVHVEDGFTGDPINADFIQVNYYKKVEDVGWVLVYSTSVNDSGETGFIQAQLDEGLDQQLSKIEVNTDNESYKKGEYLPFYVYPLDPDNTPPVAILDFNVYYTNVGEVISFDGSASYDPDGTITHYEWDFGDGTGAGGADENITYHIYENAEGSPYTLTLTVTDNEGASNSTTALVYVNEPPVVYLHVWWGLLRIGGSGANGHAHLNGKVNRDYTFKPYGLLGDTHDPDGHIIGYQWKTGTGNPPWHSGSTVPNKTYSWSSPGTYEVTLSVKDNSSCIRYAKITMHISS